MTNISMTEMYITDNTGKLRIWSIGAVNSKIIIQHGEVGGSIQSKLSHVAVNKSGRTHKEQIMLEMAAKISRQRDKGYIRDKAKARAGRATNQLELKKPMLAKPYKDVKKIQDGAYVQFKYDGNRCMIHNTGSELIAYSRNGKRVTTIDHILETIDIPEGWTLDGELYAHGVMLQTIVSWVKRKQENTMKLKYMVYDVMLNAPYNQRLLALENGLLSADNLPYTLAPTRLLNSATEEFGGVSGALNSAIGLGYEGLIIRHGDAPYEDGKRSRSLIKVKAWQDEWFEIIDITSSKDGWAVLQCDGFNVSCPGTIAHKTMVLEESFDYIGKQVRVEYAYKTKDGIPFHPIATLIE